MERGKQSRGPYEVPTYEAPADAAWFHFLHGNVPGHQIDFIYRHVVPWGPLSRQHFGHLVRILQYIEPRDPREQAFAIGNLSRDDTQHEPGHGGIALVLSLRVHGARDHAGREDPSFSHAIVAADRAFDAEAFLSAAQAFRRQLVDSTRMTAEGVGFYHAYTSCGEDPVRAGALLRSYVADFNNLQAPEPSTFSLQWTASGIEQPRRIVILHDDNLVFDDLARCAARIAAVLYTSDVRWTLISNGREEDLPNGTTIRFVPESVGAAADNGVVVHRIEDLPERAEALAWKLFQAKPVGFPGEAGKRRNWRTDVPEQHEIEVTIEDTPRNEVKKTAKRRSWGWVGLVVPLVLVIGGVYAMRLTREQETGQRIEVAVNVQSAQTPAPMTPPAPPMASAKPAPTDAPERPETAAAPSATMTYEQPRATRRTPKTRKCTSDFENCTTKERKVGGR